MGRVVYLGRLRQELVDLRLVGVWRRKQVARSGRDGGGEGDLMLGEVGFNAGWQNKAAFCV